MGRPAEQPCGPSYWQWPPWQGGGSRGCPETCLPPGRGGVGGGRCQSPIATKASHQEVPAKPSWVLTESRALDHFLHLTTLQPVSRLHPKETRQRRRASLPGPHTQARASTSSTEHIPAPHSSAGTAGDQAQPPFLAPLAVHMSLHRQPPRHGRGLALGPVGQRHSGETIPNCRAQLVLTYYQAQIPSPQRAHRGRLPGVWSAACRPGVGKIQAQQLSLSPAVSYSRIPSQSEATRCRVLPCSSRKAEPQHHIHSGLQGRSPGAAPFPDLVALAMASAVCLKTLWRRSVS